MSERDPIDKMREDWKTVAQHRIATGDWTKADQDEIAAEVKAAVTAGGTADSLLLCWQMWLANEAEEIRRWSSRVRDVEKRIKAEASARRVKATA